jgi:hypothetical protein
MLSASQAPCPDLCSQAQWRRDASRPHGSNAGAENSGCWLRVGHSVLGDDSYGFQLACGVAYSSMDPQRQQRLVETFGENTSRRRQNLESGCGSLSNNKYIGSAPAQFRNDLLCEEKGGFDVDCSCL